MQEAVGQGRKAAAQIRRKRPGSMYTNTVSCKVVYKRAGLRVPKDIRMDMAMNRMGNTRPGCFSAVPLMPEIFQDGRQVCALFRASDLDSQM